MTLQTYKLFKFNKMKIFTVAKHYFNHPSIWLYISIAIVLGYISISQDYFIQNWYAFIIIITIAPFFEWVVHKYILHIKIGNVLEVENQNNYKKGDVFKMNLNNKTTEVEVLLVKENKIQIGYGFAKYKIIRNYMQRLHFGHHTNPEIVELTFAQPTAALLIFINFFYFDFFNYFSNRVCSCIYFLPCTILFTLRMDAPCTPYSRLQTYFSMEQYT